MERIVIMCRSLTYAQAAARTLERGGVATAVVKIPQTVSQTGCHYGVQISERHLEISIALLKKQTRPFGKVFRYTADGGMEEVQL